MTPLRNTNFLNLLLDYSREEHLNVLYSNIEPIDYKIETIKSPNWTNEQWLSNNELPYVALSHLLDSYYCLPNRPDMAFTHLWKSINNTYKTFSIVDYSSPSDSQGVSSLVDRIFQIKDRKINPNTSIIDLLDQYFALMPIKPLKFVSNILLKNYAVHEAGIETKYTSSSYFTFKAKYENIFTPFVSTYGNAYKRITNPSIVLNKVELNITNLEKSKSIPDSLALKLKELVVTKETNVSSSDHASTHQIRFVDERQQIDFVIRMILYSIRNSSVHGNVVSRLNSDFISQDSLKAAIYIYFLGHFILSIGLYCSNKLTIEDLGINLSNKAILEQILSS